jgi:hypothetical protein
MYRSGLLKRYYGKISRNNNLRPPAPCTFTTEHNITFTTNFTLTVSYMMSVCIHVNFREMLRWLEPHLLQRHVTSYGFTETCVDTAT